ncbi:MAG: AAA family ATPase [Luteolibacter sp.]
MTTAPQKKGDATPHHAKPRPQQSKAESNPTLAGDKREMKIGAHAPYEQNAITQTERILAAQMEHGAVGPLDISPEIMPTPELVNLAQLIRDALADGAKSWPEVVGYALDKLEDQEAQDHARIRISGIAESAYSRPEMMGEAVRIVIEYDKCKRLQLLTWKLQSAQDNSGNVPAVLREIAEMEASQAKGNGHSIIVRGVMSYPTESPPETILLGNGWIRRADVATFISTAGAGKSVAVTQAAMAWGLGLPYLGIKPARPLRILLFSGEDDGVTIGQCREGLLEHSEAITGRKLTAQDLAPLDSMLRIEFIREHVGNGFHVHLAGLLRDEPADLVIVNPLLSYVGGEIVSCASEWLRGGLMPIMQEHDCAALVAHHTPKLAKDGWENTDDTYSAIGGAELANIPRAILTLRPTAADGLSVVKVAKRQTTGWQDDDGKFTSCYFVKRSDNPERPAWIPVAHDEAQELIAAGKPSVSGKEGSKKATAGHVVELLAGGAMQRQMLIERIREKCNCSDKPARDAIIEAQSDEVIETFTEKNPKGGHDLRWFCLPEQKGQWVK